MSSQSKNHPAIFAVRCVKAYAPLEHRKVYHAREGKRPCHKWPFGTLEVQVVPGDWRNISRKAFEPCNAKRLPLFPHLPQAVAEATPLAA